jgi:hypothetical protein
MCSGRIRSSCFTSGTRRVNLVTNPVITITQVINEHEQYKGIEPSNDTKTSNTIIQKHGNRKMTILTKILWYMKVIGNLWFVVLNLQRVVKSLPSKILK